MSLIRPTTSPRWIWRPDMLTLTVSGGFIPVEAMNRFAIPRINIPAGLSDLGFALCAAGLWPR